MATADLAGWLFRLHALVHPGWNASAAVFSAALCLLLCGLALLAAELLPSSRQLQFVLGSLVVLIALLAVAENLAHRNLGLDLPLIHSDFLLATDAPGRMPLNLALALLSLGTALLLSLYSTSRNLVRLLLGLIAFTFLLGVCGLWAYWRDMQWIYERSDTLNALRMAPDAATLLVLLPLALWAQARRRFGAPLREPSELALRGFRSLAVALVAIVLLGYGIGLVVFQSLSLNLAAADLFRSLESRRSLIRQSLATASTRAQTSTYPADFALPLRWFDRDPHSPRAVAQLYSAGQNLAQRGLPAIAIEGADRGFLAMGGFVSHPAAQLDIHGDTPARLLWANGYKLDMGIPVRDPAGLAGVVVIQQPLDELDGLALETDSQDAATVAGICGAAGGALSCFPPQALAAGFTLIQASGDTLLPVHLATRNREGTAPGFNPQGNRVLVAYGPIAGTGLGVVLERRVSTMFAPVRSRLQFLNVWLAVLLPCSLWVVRKQFQKQAVAIKEMSSLYSGSLVRLELPTRPEFLTDSSRPRIAVPSPDTFSFPHEPVPVRSTRSAGDTFQASPQPVPIPVPRHREPRKDEPEAAPTPRPPLHPIAADSPAIHPGTAPGPSTFAAPPATNVARPVASAIPVAPPASRPATPPPAVRPSEPVVTPAPVPAPSQSPIPAQPKTALNDVPTDPATPAARPISARTPASASLIPSTRAASPQPESSTRPVVSQPTVVIVAQSAPSEKDAWGQPVTFEGFLASVLLAIHPPPPEAEGIDVSTESELLAGQEPTEMDVEEAGEPDQPTLPHPRAGYYRESPPAQRRAAHARSGWKVSRMMVFLTLTGAFAAGVAITTGILGQIETDEPGQQ